jgi:tRNA G18 (ribose-2'-O)-methylase SpoU
LTRIIACGKPRLDSKIARIEPSEFTVETHRSLPPVLADLRQRGHELVGLEQTSGSQCLHSFRFSRSTALVVGNERSGLSDEALQLLDRVVEIPVYGLPYSYNVATAVAMSLYEYCRQFPQG